MKKKDKDPFAGKPFGAPTVPQKPMFSNAHPSKTTPVQPVSVSAESSGKDEISDEDFDIADDFMSGLGC